MTVVHDSKAKEGSSYGHGRFSFQSRSSFKPLQSGLSNLGNTCYFNSVMQVMAATEILHDVLDSDDRPIYHDENLKLRKECLIANDENIGNLTRSFRDILRLMWIQKGGTISPRDLFSQIRLKRGQFKGYQQQDSHELLRVLLEALENEELDLLHKMHPKLKAVKKKRPRKSITSEAQGSKSLVNLIFGGKLASMTVCDVCKNISTVYEDFLDLSLPIKPESGIKIRKRDRIKVALKGPETGFRRSLSPAATSGSRSDDNSKKAQGFLRKSPSDSSGSTSNVEMCEHSGDDSAASESDRLGVGPKSSKSAPKSLEGYSCTTASSNISSDDYLMKLHELLRPDQGSFLSRNEYSLNNCLRRFTAVEILDGENSFACENCWKLQNMEDCDDETESSHSGSLSNDVPVIKNRQETITEADGSKMETVSKCSTNVDETTGKRLKRSAQQSTNTMDITIAEASAISKPSPRRGKSNRSARYVLQPARRRYLLADLPCVLVAHFKRFQQTSRGVFGSIKKADDYVSFPDTLNTENLMIPSNGDQQGERHRTIYRLYGVVVHMGSMTSGHYVAYVLTHKYGEKDVVDKEKDGSEKKETSSSERKWIHCSDSHVRPASWDEVSKVKAYLLFYERI